MTEHTELLPDPLPAEPLAVAGELARARPGRPACQPNPNAMVLATEQPPTASPSARVVLCKDIVPQPGYIVFYTNYLSTKGRQLKDNPRAAAVMHWDACTGRCASRARSRSRPPPTATRYFASRAWHKRIGRLGERAERAGRLARALLEAVAGRRRALRHPGAGHRGADERVDHECRARRTGAATGCGRRRWSCGSKAMRACTTARAGRARSRASSDGSFRTGPWSATRLQP